MNSLERVTLFMNDQLLQLPAETIKSLTTFDLCCMTTRHKKEDKTISFRYIITFHLFRHQMEKLWWISFYANFVWSSLVWRSGSSLEGSFCCLRIRKNKFSDISRDCKQDGPEMCEDFLRRSNSENKRKFIKFSLRYLWLHFMIIEFRIKIMALIWYLLFIGELLCH